MNPADSSRPAQTSVSLMLGSYQGQAGIVCSARVIKTFFCSVCHLNAPVLETEVLVVSPHPLTAFRADNTVGLHKFVLQG